jgi:hypothetical protein
MADPGNQSVWAAIIKSIQSPLGLLALLALILYGILVSFLVSGKQPNWELFSLLGILIIGILFMVYKNPKNLYKSKDWPNPPKNISIILKSIYENPGDPPTEINFDPEKCYLIFYNPNSKPVRKKANLNLAKSSGRWSCSISEDIDQFGGISLDLTEKNGQRWELTKCNLYEKEENIKKIIEVS